MIRRGATIDIGGEDSIDAEDSSHCDRSANLGGGSRGWEAAWSVMHRLGNAAPTESPPESPSWSPAQSRKGLSRGPRLVSWAGRRVQGKGAALLVGALAVGTVLQITSLFGGFGSGVQSRKSRMSEHRRNFGIARTAGNLPPEAFAPPQVALGGLGGSGDAYGGSGVEEEPGLTTADAAYMAAVAGFANFTSFVRMPSRRSSGQSAEASAIPCLWSEALQRNVYLIPGGWDQTSSRSSAQDRHSCPTPKGGQLPPAATRPDKSGSSFFGGSSEEEAADHRGQVDDVSRDDDDLAVTREGGWRPEVTFVVSVLRKESVHPRMASSVALETAIAIFRHADEVPASEFIFIDHTTSPIVDNVPSPDEATNGNAAEAASVSTGSVHELDRTGLRLDGSLDLTELEQFLSFLENAFGLHIRFLRMSSLSAGLGGNAYLDLIRAAAGLGSGRLLCLVEAGNILQPGALQALVSVMEGYPEAAMVVPKLLRQDGRVHEAGGVLLNDGSLVRFGHGMESDDPSVGFVRDVDYGSWALAVVRRRLMKRLDLPDTRFRPGFFADADASLTLRASGWRVLYTPFAHAIHYESGGSGGSGSTPEGLGGWAAWVPLHLSSAGAQVLERLATHGVPGDASAGRGLWPEGRRRSVALNQHKLASKWAPALSCHWPPGSLPLTPLLGHNAPVSASVGIDASLKAVVAPEAEAMEAARVAVQRSGRFAAAGGVLKAFDEVSGAYSGVAGSKQQPLTPQQVLASAAAVELKRKAAEDEAARGAAGRGLDFLSSRGSSLRVLFVDWIAPEVDRDSGSIRARYMIQILLSMRCAVTFVAVDTNRPLHYRDELRFMGVKVLTLNQLRASLHAPSLAAISTPRAKAVAAGAMVVNSSEGLGSDSAGWPCPFDVIILSRRDAFRAAFSLLSHDPAACDGVPVIFDTVDLHFLREAREAAYRDKYVKRGSSDSGADGGAMLEAIFGRKETTAKRGLRDRQESSRASREAAQDVELQFVAFSTVTLVVSPFEATEVAARVPRAVIRVVSNIHVLEPTPLGFWERSGAVFTGNFNHLPNRDAVLFFAQEILPLIHPRVGPDFVFHVIGANQCPEAIARLNGTMIDGVVRIIVHGYVEDLRAFYGNMRVSVVPLRWGAGVKGKVNSAMSHGVPVICSTVAQEGMHLVDGEDALIADDPAAFASKVIEAYTTERIWQRLREGGFANIRTYFSISHAVRGMVDTLDVVLNGHKSSISATTTAAAESYSALLPASSLETSGSDGGVPLDQSPPADSAKARARLAFGGCAIDPRCACTPGSVQVSLAQALPTPRPLQITVPLQAS